MIDAISIASAHGGGTVNLSVGATSTGAYKVQRFGWQRQFSGSPGLPKLQTYGSWPSITDVRGMVLDLEGMIVGSSPSDYWDKRIAFLAACLPPYNSSRTIRHHCTITATPPGESAMSCQAVVAEEDFPMTKDLGRAADYRISFFIAAAYWAVGGTPVIR